MTLHETKQILNKTLNHKKTKKKTNINQNNKGQIWYKNQ
jgi:hypothetical protein